jgi:hypothetical protein
MNTDNVKNTESEPVDFNTEQVNNNQEPTLRKVGHPDVGNASDEAVSQPTPDEMPVPQPLPQDDQPGQDPIEFIKAMLESKSTAKQITFKHVEEAFSLLCNDSNRIITELQNKTNCHTEEVTLYFKNISKHEFHLKLAGDLLIYVMHTNIVTFDDEHEVIKEEYTRSNPVNRYFGQINIYNFMYDSLRYNRGNDPGYLIGRLMINHENRFFMEGEQQFTSFYGTISENPISEPDLQNIVKISLKVAIKNDLMAPPYSRVRSITLNQKNEHTVELGGGQKIGFRMSYDK